MKMMNIKNQTKPFDEMQISKRNKFGTHSFYISVFLIIANIIIKTLYGIWATPITEGICLLIIPLFYFISRCILNDAYVTNNKFIKNMIVSDLFITAIFLTLFIIFTKRTAIISDGILSDDFAIICADVFIVFIGSIYLFKNFLNSKVFD